MVQGERETNRLDSFLSSGAGPMNGIYQIWRLIAEFRILGTADRLSMSGSNSVKVLLLWLVVVEAMEWLETREKWKRERTGHAGLV